MYLCLLRMAGRIPDNSLLLVHGLEDTTVSISQSWLLSQALATEGVLFKQMIYPRAGHDLSTVRNHLHQTLEKYFLEVRSGILT